MSHLHSALCATSVVFFQLLVGAAIGEERAPSVDQPLILELRLQSVDRSLRQEILVSEGDAFRGVTQDDQLRWVIERLGKCRQGRAREDSRKHSG